MCNNSYIQIYRVAKSYFFPPVSPIPRTHAQCFLDSRQAPPRQLEFSNYHHWPRSLAWPDDQRQDARPCLSARYNV